MIDWVQITDELNSKMDDDSNETIEFKKYLNRVISPL